MPCMGRGALPSITFRNLFKRIKCHIACCKGVVIEIVDDQEEYEDAAKTEEMEDGTTGHTHVRKVILHARKTCCICWRQAISWYRTRKRNQAIDIEEMARIAGSVYLTQACAQAV